jgi:hypothetical protein
VANGTVLATGDGLPWIFEFEAGVEYYEGSGQTAGGPRVFFTAGTQESDVPNVGRGEMNLTAEGLAIFLATVDELIPAKMSDITVPSDIVKGIPDDGDWPGAEHPALAIDNNVNTKYLHFKGDFDPDPGTGGSGIKITPLDGPSVVTGLALTTANDVPGRDPIAFALSGSNDSIDGPYTLIAEGDVVDFAGENAWPRFTKNETPIAFDNDKSYTHYQLIFTAIRGPVGGSVNSMQIAEVELLEIDDICPPWPPWPPPPPPPPPIENILANGGFEDGVADPWSTYGDASLEVVQEDPVEGDYCLHVTVNSAGANFWDSGLQHTGHVFEAGKSYALSAWFKSKAGEFEINMKPERAGSPWEPYGEQRIILTEEWAEYTTETGVIPETVDPASITFHIAFTAGEFFVDDVEFYEVE